MFTKSAEHIESIMAHALKLYVIQLKLPIEVVIDSAIIELYCSYWRKNTSVITSQQGNGWGEIPLRNMQVPQKVTPLTQFYWQKIV
jgi:hypothetical protein